MTMQDWICKLDDFLRFNEKEILKHRGKISKELAAQKASKEYDKFNAKRLKTYKSDFDRLVERVVKMRGRIRKGIAT